ncbi:MAG: hypothetical protein KC449_20335 [Anaerolineales bacterium]|nr:hypothetical protein [Anaerolineales bacterium]
MEKQTARPKLPVNDASLSLEGHWLIIARVAWLLITGVGIVMFAIGVRLLFQQLATTCTGSDCLRQQLTPEALPAMAEIGLTLTGYAFIQSIPTAIFAVVCVALGALIFWQRSHEVMGFSSSLWLVTFGLTLFEEEVRATSAAYPWLQPAAVGLVWLGGVILLPLFFCIFPNGRFAPRWTKWGWLITSALFVGFGTAAELFPAFDAIYKAFGGYLWFTMLLGSIAIQFYRYRYLSTPNERQQTKWVVFAFIVTVAVLVIMFLINPLFLDFRVAETENAVRNILGNAISTIAFLMIPLGISISILRYRLYDIDLIIRRTVQYSVVSAVLALVYFGSITLIQGGVTAVANTQSPLAIVLSTLLIAALFNPVRQRVQIFIDRRFYRQKYNAQQVLARFAQTSRDEVELETLTTELIRVVQETMQPETVQLQMVAPAKLANPPK